MHPTRWPAVALAVLLVTQATLLQAAPDDNATGLPAYPNLTRAGMDANFRTEALGRQCARFTGATTDSLLTVEEWYRKNLRNASETDLANDSSYKSYAALSGIKLALGRDYVAVYRVGIQETIIELHRCTWI
ncbi:MAG TPA: hypothetical protein VGI93_03880 [Steroidobacteraceae bacterium]|jgi:hypothetical protein